MRRHQINVRFSDLRSRGAGGYELRVSSPQVTGGDGWPIVDLLDFRHHMRCLEMGSKIPESSKRDWEAMSNEHLQTFAVEGWEAKCANPKSEPMSNGLHQCMF